MLRIEIYSFEVGFMRNDIEAWVQDEDDVARLRRSLRETYFQIMVWGKSEPPKDVAEIFVFSPEDQLFGVDHDLALLTVRGYRCMRIAQQLARLICRPFSVVSVHEYDAPIEEGWSCPVTDW